MGNNSSTEILEDRNVKTSEDSYTGVALSHKDFKDIIYGNIIYTFNIKEKKGALPTFEENYYKKNKEVVDNYINAHILNNYQNLSKFMKFIKCNEKNNDFMDCITEKSIISAINKNKPTKQKVSKLKPSSAYGTHAEVDEDIAASPREIAVQSPFIQNNAIVHDNIIANDNIIAYDNITKTKKSPRKRSPVSNKTAFNETASQETRQPHVKPTSSQKSGNVSKEIANTIRGCIVKNKTKIIEDKINAKIRQLEVDIINERADDVLSDITKQGEYDQESI